MGRRSPDEPHRAATPLELFFDLVFVVAIARASSSLEHEIIAGNVGEAVVNYLAVFFAIWWAWMNFTWFASAYDNDDVPYRLAVFVQLIGALILAAGVPEVVEHRNFAITTLGYVVMRLALVAQWLRAAHDDPHGRPAALRFAAGISVLQVGWVVLLVVPDPFNSDRIHRPRDRRIGGPRVGRAGGADVVAPRAHLGAIRVVHDHRAGRVDPRRLGGDRCRRRES